MKLTYKDKYIVGKGDYTMYKAQARRIFFGKARRFKCECWRWYPQKGYCEAKPNLSLPVTHPITRLPHGAVKIGCVLLRRTQVRRIRAWIRGER